MAERVTCISGTYERSSTDYTPEPERCRENNDLQIYCGKFDHPQGLNQNVLYKYRLCLRMSRCTPRWISTLPTDARVQEVVGTEDRTSSNLSIFDCIFYPIFSNIYPIFISSFDNVD